MVLREAYVVSRIVPRSATSTVESLFTLFFLRPHIFVVVVVMVVIIFVRFTLGVAFGDTRAVPNSVR